MVAENCRGGSEVLENGLQRTHDLRAVGNRLSPTSAVIFYPRLIAECRRPSEHLAQPSTASLLTTTSSPLRVLPHFLYRLICSFLDISECISPKPS